MIEIEDYCHLSVHIMDGIRGTFLVASRLSEMASVPNHSSLPCIKVIRYEHCREVVTTARS